VFYEKNRLILRRSFRFAFICNDLTETIVPILVFKVPIFVFKVPIFVFKVPIFVFKVPILVFIDRILALPVNLLDYPNGHAKICSRKFNIQFSKTGHGN